MTKLTLCAVFLSLNAFTHASLLSSTDPSKDSKSMPLSTSIDLQGNYQVENGCGLILSTSALYWKAYEEGLEYVIENNGTSGVDSEGRVERANFDWDWGFRLNLGYQVPPKKMDLNACWTYFKTQNTTSDTATSPNTFFSVWSIPSTTSGTAYEYHSNAHTRLILNMLDLGMGTTFSPRPFLDITPFIDLSSVWIHQKFHFDLSGGPGLSGLSVIDDSIHMKNDFWGIGPKVGMNTLWNLGWGFGICGNFNFSLLWGIFNITQEENTTYFGTIPITYLDIDHNKFHALRLNCNLFLGMRWDKMFGANRRHFFLEAGWETLIFLGQNQLMRFTTQSNSGINVSGKGDLGLQGLSMRIGVNI